MCRRPRLVCLRQLRKWGLFFSREVQYPDSFVIIAHELHWHRSRRHDARHFDRSMQRLPQDLRYALCTSLQAGSQFNVPCQLGLIRIIRCVGTAIMSECATLVLRLSNHYAQNAWLQRTGIHSLVETSSHAHGVFWGHFIISARVRFYC